MSVHRRKQCRTCKDTFAIRCFYRHPTTRDGHMSNCKRCHRAAVAENKRLKREYYNALGRALYPRYKQAKRAYESRPEVRERIRARQRENYRLDRIEVRA